jgi:uncharacterized protein YecE (DUF72 family)
VTSSAPLKGSRFITHNLKQLRRERHPRAADTAGRYPYADEVTADFVYVRLHGSQEPYVSGYTDAELDAWAKRVKRWRRDGRDVYVYFDNDAKVHAPFDALRLTEGVRHA